MKKIILLTVFSIVSFYFGQAMACSQASGDRNQSTKYTVAQANAVGDYYKKKK